MTKQPKKHFLNPNDLVGIMLVKLDFKGKCELAPFSTWKDEEWLGS